MNTTPRRRPYARTYDQRRRAVLQTAWDMMADTGDDQFSLRELSVRSGVSLRTIYNAFQNREGVVAQTLIAHHADLFTDVVVGANDSRSLNEAYEMCRRVAQETILAKAVAVTTSRAYFASDGRTHVAAAMQELPSSIVTAWMRSDEADAGRIALFGADDVSRQFANAQWSLVAEWVAGVISDADLVHQQTRTILCVGLAFGNEKGQAAAMRLLAPAAGSD